MKSRTIPVSLAATAALLFAASSPVCAETHSLQPYAYVQSYGCNGVDTGYCAKDTTKFVVDFEFTDTSYKSWLMGAGQNNHKQCHAIYLNGSKQLAWTTRGQFWATSWGENPKIAGSSIKDVRLVQTIESAGSVRDDIKTSLIYVDGSQPDRAHHLTGTDGTVLTSTGPSDIPTYLFRANGDLEENANQKSKVKIYSFEADDDCTSGVPAVFLAPAEQDGAAGFTNIIDGTFHGEICGDAATTALSYSDGIGNAADYKWEDSEFSAKFYAYSENSAEGLVKFGADAAADETAAWIARGESATLTAVPADGYIFAGWKGDTRAITSPGTAADATVTVRSDRAGQLLATFARTTARKAFDTGDYVQSGEEALLVQLDGIRNAEGGAHETAPATWCDLASGTLVATNGSPSFSSDAWAANGKSFFNFTSDAVTNAFAKKSFTLEMFISHPAISGGYAYWIYSGNSVNRQLTAELRWPNSHNPLIEGVQWGESTWNERSKFANGSITAWNTRQHIAIVCDETGATTYCNGTKIHHTVGGGLEPTMDNISIGADLNGGSPVKNGAEICAVRMTARVLSVDEIKYNAAIDARRFVDGGAAAAGETANVVVESSSAMDPLAALEADLSGRYIAAAGDVFVAPAIACIDGFCYRLDGYTLQTWDETNGAWGEAEAHDDERSYTATGAGKVRVTWQWTKVLRSDEGTIDDYAQSSDDMLLHLDGILNAGAAAGHETSPSAWVDLVSGASVAASGSPSFSADAWVADNESYFSTASTAVKNALAAKNFTLELMISHPGDQVKNQYDNWVYIGSEKVRQLIVDLREPNSSNPLVQGVQYRETTWNNRSQLAVNNACKWNTRQYVAVVCDEDGATTYCDGTQIHTNGGGSNDPSLGDITIGATKTGSSKLKSGAEICAVRMTKRALTQEEMARNQAVDHVRFTPDVIVVNGEIGATGVAGESSLPSGNYDLEAGTWKFTAADVSKDGRTYKPYLTVETLTDGEWVQTAKLWTDSYTVDKAELGSSRIRLTWTWAIRPGLIIMIQ